MNISVCDDANHASRWLSLWCVQAAVPAATNAGRNAQALQLTHRHPSGVLPAVYLDTTAMNTAHTLWFAAPAGDGSCNCWGRWQQSATFPTAAEAHAQARISRATFHGHLFAVRLAGWENRPLPPQGSTREEARLGILQQLQTIDPNGSWLDDRAIADCCEPLTLVEARQQLEQMHANA